MRIKIFHILIGLIVAYFLLVSTVVEAFSIYSIIFLVVALLLDYFTDIKRGIKNLLYVLAALSPFLPLFGIFALYLPFTVFGLLFKKRNFIRSYVFGYAVSFIPTILLYLFSTYLNVSLNIFTVIFVYYLFPLAAILFIYKKKKPLDFLHVGNKEFLMIIVVLFFTVFIGSNIINDDLFIANGVRVFARTQIAFDGLSEEGLFPSYDPRIAQGEATYLWNAPPFFAQVALGNFMLGFFEPLIFFNAYSLFILFISTLGLSILFRSITGKYESKLNTHTLIILAGTLSAGLNFYFIQRLESIKQFSASPVDFLLLAILLDDLEDFKDYIIAAFLLILTILIHVSHSPGIVLMAAAIILIKKFGKIQNLFKDFISWFSKNKTKFLVAFVIFLFLPMFYFSSNIIFSDSLRDLPKINYGTMIPNTIIELKGLFRPENNPISLKYPDITRNDDEKFGPFISVAGVISFFILILLFKAKGLGNFRIFAFAYISHFVLISVLTQVPKVAILALFYGRSVHPYLLILMVASIVTLVSIMKGKYLRIALIIVFLIAFLFTLPAVKENIQNIHVERIASGNIFKDEIDFTKSLPVDGRIMTYGIFSNAFDFGFGYLTDRYFSRSERVELGIDRSIFEKIHGQNSFGEPDLLAGKSGTELTNYLRLGGYKYIFLSVAHPIGNGVVQQIYPDLSAGLYQNGAYTFLSVNGTNYAEKIDLVEKVDDEIYKLTGGYRHTTISEHYDFEYDDIDFKESPKEPEPLSFERISDSKLKIFGDFKEDEWVVFKEQYFKRWKATMGGEEIPVYANNHEMILVRTIEGDEITLEYSPLPSERIIGILSIIGFLALIVMFILLL